MFVQPINYVQEISSRSICALPPVFSVCFGNEVPRLYLATVETSSVHYSEGFLVLDRPGESALEIIFEVNCKLDFPYLLSLNGEKTSGVLITLNGKEVAQSDVTQHILEGKNILRIELLEDAQDDFYLTSAAISIRFNPFTKVDL